MTDSIPHSRRARRQAQFEAQKASTSFTSSIISDLPSSPPVTDDVGSERPGKTLVQLIEERQHLFSPELASSPRSTSTSSINPKIIAHQIHPNSSSVSSLSSSTTTPSNSLPHLSSSSSSSSDDPTTLILTTLLPTLTLTLLHFTLSVLVAHQYLQTLSLPRIFLASLRAIPPLSVLIYLLHRPARTNHPLTQLFHFAVATAAGTYLVHVSNVADYYAVMKRAPALGTLWVWSTVEMRVPLAVGSLACVGAFLWWGGYSII